MAEDMLQQLACPEKYYIATMQPYGAEAEQRIMRHQALRADKGFTTLECYTRLQSLEVPAHSAVLLECIGNLVANVMFSPERFGQDPTEAVWEDLGLLRQQASHLIIVSNDVGSDGTRYDAETLAYQQAVGVLNRRLSATSDVVIETVCGIPLFLKGEDTCLSCTH